MFRLGSSVCIHSSSSRRLACIFRAHVQVLLAAAGGGGGMVALNGRIHQISEELSAPAPDVFSLLSSHPQLSGWADWVELVGLGLGLLRSLVWCRQSVGLHVSQIREVGVDVSFEDSITLCLFSHGRCRKKEKKSSVSCVAWLTWA